MQSIIPATEPCEFQQSEVLAALGVHPSLHTCVYCGAEARHWDHLNPLVAKKRPTGFLNNAYNRVPACDQCNTSKSGHPWRVWISGAAKGSPASRGIPDLNDRIARLEAFETKYGLEPEDLESIVGAELWNEYWSMRQSIEDKMFEAQELADRIRERIHRALG